MQEKEDQAKTKISEKIEEKPKEPNEHTFSYNELTLHL